MCPHDCNALSKCFHPSGLLINLDATPDVTQLSDLPTVPSTHPPVQQVKGHKPGQLHSNAFTYYKHGRCWPCSSSPSRLAHSLRAAFSSGPNKLSFHILQRMEAYTS